MGLWFEGSNALQTESVALLLAFARLVIHSTDPPRIEGIKQLLNRLGNVGSSRQLPIIISISFKEAQLTLIVTSQTIKPWRGCIYLELAELSFAWLFFLVFWFELESDACYLRLHEVK